MQGGARVKFTIDIACLKPDGRFFERRQNPLSSSQAATIAASRSRWAGLRVLPAVGALDRDLVGHESGVVPDAPDEGRAPSRLCQGRPRKYTPGSGVSGAERHLDPALATQPESNPLAGAGEGVFIEACDQATQEVYDRIWTNLRK